jgi:hypothetical protein
MTTSDGITDDLCDVYRFASLIFRCFRTLNLYLSCQEQWFVIINPYRYNLDLIYVVLWTRLRVSFNAYVRSFV